MASSNAPSRLAVELAFTAITTSEATRQRLVGPGTETLSELKVERIYAERVAGSGTVTFTVRIYDSAASALGAFVDADFALAASGVDAQQAVQGFDALFSAGAWVTVEAASGSGHEVNVTVQYTTARG